MPFARPTCCFVSLLRSGTGRFDLALHTSHLYIQQFPWCDPEMGVWSRVYGNTIYLQAQQHSFNYCLHLIAPSLLKYLLNESDTIPKSKISIWEEIFKTFAVFLMTGHLWLAKQMTQGHSDIQIHMYTSMSFWKKYMLWFFRDMNARKHMVSCLDHQTFTAELCTLPLDCY